MCVHSYGSKERVWVELCIGNWNFQLPLFPRKSCGSWNGRGLALEQEWEESSVAAWEWETVGIRNPLSVADI